VNVVSVGIRSALRWNLCAARLALSIPRRSKAACSFLAETTVSGESSCRCLCGRERRTRFKVLIQYTVIVSHRLPSLSSPI